MNKSNTRLSYVIPGTDRHSHQASSCYTTGVAEGKIGIDGKLAGRLVGFSRNLKPSFRGAALWNGRFINGSIRKPTHDTKGQCVFFSSRLARTVLSQSTSAIEWSISHYSIMELIKVLILLSLLIPCIRASQKAGPYQVSTSS